MQLLGPGSDSATFKGRQKLTLLISIFLPSLVVTYLANSGQVFDPFMRYDDFAALLGRPDEYYRKTLEEGRWLNYLWTQRSFLWSAETNLLIYHVSWTLFSAAFAAAAFTSFPWRTALGSGLLCASLIIVTPQSLDIAHSYNTLLPSVVLLAAYSLICLFARGTVALLSMIVFVPVVFSAHNTFPFILLACHLLASTGPKSLYSLTISLTTFCAAFALALAASYGLNYVYHGVFGIAAAEWRGLPSSLNSWTGSPKINSLLAIGWGVFFVTSYGRAWLGALVFGLFFFAIIRIARDEGRVAFLKLFVSCFFGIGLLAVYAVQNEILIPPRATIFMWIGVAFALVRAAVLQGTPLVLRAMLLMSCFVAIVSGTLSFSRAQDTFRSWQDETRSLAEAIPVQANNLYIAGDHLAIKGARKASIQDPTALRDRLRYLTGLNVELCIDQRAECDALRDFVKPFAQLGTSEIWASSDGLRVLFVVGD